MSGFWNTSENKPVQASNDFEVTTALEPIPSNELLRSIITEAKWAEYQGDEYINARWDVIEGEYKGRVLFQKIRVKDASDKKRDKAIQMLAAIDANAGGKLMSSGKEPTDVAMMQHLCNKPMVIRVRIWSMEDEVTKEVRTGNWIDGVFSASGSAPVKKKAAPASALSTDFDDDIGF